MAWRSLKAWRLTRNPSRNVWRPTVSACFRFHHLTFSPWRPQAALAARHLWSPCAGTEAPGLTSPGRGVQPRRAGYCRVYSLMMSFLGRKKAAPGGSSRDRSEIRRAGLPWSPLYSPSESKSGHARETPIAPKSSGDCNPEATSCLQRQGAAEPGH